jgi:periplasmic mercuric ion binding protein
MKKQLFLTLAFLLGAMTVSMGQKSPQKVTIKTSAICEMCKERIERQLAYTSGVKEAVLNLDDKTVVVTFNQKKTSVDKIKQSISEVGYDADEVVADAKGYSKLPACCRKDAAPHH